MNYLNYIWIIFPFPKFFPPNFFIFLLTTYYFEISD